MSRPTFSCFVIGSDTLLTECAGHLADEGHDVRGVVTDTPRIAAWARDRGLAVVEPDAMHEALAARPFDHLFAITWLRLLPERVLSLPRGMAVNFHDGPLPARAGLNVPAWGLMDGVREWAVTWHEITPGIDTGAILLETPVAVAEDDTSLSLNMKCFAAARDGFPELVRRLADGTLAGTPQPDGERRVHYRSDRPDLGGLLDWRRPARNLAARVRALDFGPYPNPIGRAKLLDAEGRAWIVAGAGVAPAETADTDAAPGTVIRRDEGGWTIATGEGALHLMALSSLTGGPVDPGAASGAASRTDRPALDPGSALPLLDDQEARALDAAVTAAAGHEDRIHGRLASLDPPGFPPVADTAVPGSGPLRTVQVEVPADARLGATRFEATVVGAWVILLARWGRRTPFDLAWFDETTTRTRAEAALLSTWRVLRVTPDPDTDFDGVVRSAEAALSEARTGGDFLVDLISRRPDLADGAGLLEARLPVGVRTLGDGHETTDDITRAPAAITLVVDPERAGVALEFDPERIDAGDAGTLARGLAVLLRRGTDAPDTPWRSLPTVEGAERRALLDADDRTAAPLAESIVHERFEDQARKTPDRVAVRFEDRVLTYGELDRRASALAARLRAEGVGPDRVVGVHVHRSPELLVATLAVLKAGGAYLPLDPDFPEDRIRFMLADAGVEQVITAGPAPTVLATKGVRAVDCLAEGTGGAPAVGTPARVGPRNLAYVIYTSGSTGRPKGVLVEHGNVANFFTGMDAVVDHDEPGVWMAVTSLSFDISVLELFWTLARGFEVVIFRDRERAAGSPQGARGTGAGEAAAGVVADGRLRERGMQFGLFMWGNDDGPGPDKYRLMLDAGRYFDRNGFDSVWTPERHFHAFGGPFPNPSVTGAALAAVTERLSIRSGSVVSPLHHPIRIAEEWAVVDNLSGGRVGLAFAAGWQPNDFVLRPETYGSQKQVMVDEIDVIRRLWRGEAVSFTNPLGKAVEVTSLPRPVQPELPFWITTAGNPDTYRMAGRMGANVLTHLLGQSLDEVAEKIAAYREARAEAGLDPEGGTVTLMLHTFVGDDDEAVRALVREPMKDYLRASMKLVLGFAWTFPAFKRPGGPDSTPEDIDLGSLTDEETEAILDFAFDRYYETSGLFGTPDTCVDIVARCAAIGVDEIACLLDFGVDTSAVLDGLPLLKEVRDRSNAAFEGRATASAPETPAPGTEAAEAEDSERWTFARQLRDRGVTHLQCTPSMARLLLEQPDVEAALGGVRHLMIGGEAFPESLSAALRKAGGGRVTNMYGPTETTIWSTTHEVDEDGPVPIGRAISNTRLYVLDPGGEPVPAGVPGDLWIGGRGVVRGYHERPELTAERFRPDPFVQPTDEDGGGRGARMYWTGDLARWRPDGVLEFLGRVDHQVKVRGHRIEPGEIEAVLENLPAVSHATVVLREDVPGDQRLVAYVVGAEGFDPEGARARLASDLPSYMVPSHLVPLDAMPLTPNGKVDRAALPAPDAVAARTRPAVAPKNALEASLVDAWKQVLGLDDVGTTDNFFDAGGHSLLVVQLHRLLGDRLDQPVSLIDLYRFPTIATLAEHLSAATPDAPALDASAERGARRREMMRRRRGG